MKQKFGEMDPSWSLFDFVRSRVNDRNYFCNFLAELVMKFDILREDVQQLPPIRQHFEEERKNNGMFHQQPQPFDFKDEDPLKNLSPADQELVNLYGAKICVARWFFENDEVV